MTGMCSFCAFNAAAPGEDYCRDCLDLRAEQRRRRIQLVEQTVGRCMFGHPACTPMNPCGDCAEFAAYPRGGAA